MSDQQDQEADDLITDEEMAKIIFSHLNLSSKTTVDSKRHRNNSAEDKIGTTISSDKIKVIPAERSIQVKPTPQKTISSSKIKAIPAGRSIQVKPTPRNDTVLKPVKSTTLATVSPHSKQAQTHSNTQVEKKTISNSLTSTTSAPLVANTEQDQLTIDLDPDLIILPSSYESFASQLHDELPSNSNSSDLVKETEYTSEYPIVLSSGPTIPPIMFGDECLLFHGLHCHPVAPHTFDANYSSYSSSQYLSRFSSFEQSEHFFENLQPKNSMKYQSKICPFSASTFGNGW